MGFLLSKSVCASARSARNVLGDSHHNQCGTTDLQRERLAGTWSSHRSISRSKVRATTTPGANAGLAIALLATFFTKTNYGILLLMAVALMRLIEARGQPRRLMSRSNFYLALPMVVVFAIWFACFAVSRPNRWIFTTTAPCKAWMKP